MLFVEKTKFPNHGCITSMTCIASKKILHIVLACLPIRCYIAEQRKGKKMNKAVELLKTKERILTKELVEIQAAIELISQNGSVQSTTATTKATPKTSSRKMTVTEAMVWVFKKEPPGTRIRGLEIWKRSKGKVNAKKGSFMTGLAREARESDGIIIAIEPGLFALRES